MMEKTGTKPKILTTSIAKCKKLVKSGIKENQNPIVTVCELPIKDKTPADSQMLIPDSYLPKSLKLQAPNEPKRNSRVRTERKMTKIQEMKPKQFKNTTDLSQPEKITVEEKITKKMNFPIDKKLYKQLISLNLTERPSAPHPMPISYGPVVRDREPRLEDYFTPTIGSEYSIPVELTFSPPTSTRYYNGLRTYQLMRSWQMPD